MYNLQGKIALVTGCGGKIGMGHAIALRLAKSGADIVANDMEIMPPREKKYKDWQGLNSVVKEIEALGHNALAIPANIASSKEVNEMVAKAVERFGKIDILVNNAGVSGPRGILLKDLDEQRWRDTLDINVTGMFLCSKAVAKSMVEKGIKGKIVNIASIAGKHGNGIGRGPYNVSKFAAIGLTQTLASELASFKINVNAVCPGVVVTDLVNEAFTEPARKQGITVEQARDKYFQSYLPNIPWARLAEVEDIANAVAFLASSEADYITGQSINVDGGLLMAH